MSMDIGISIVVSVWKSVSSCLLLYGNRLLDVCFCMEIGFFTLACVWKSISSWMLLCKSGRSSFCWRYVLLGAVCAWLGWLCMGGRTNFHNMHRGNTCFGTMDIARCIQGFGRVWKQESCPMSLVPKHVLSKTGHLKNKNDKNILEVKFACSPSCIYDVTQKLQNRCLRRQGMQKCSFYTQIWLVFCSCHYTGKQTCARDVSTVFMRMTCIQNVKNNEWTPLWLNRDRISTTLRPQEQKPKMGQNSGVTL